MANFISPFEFTKQLKDAGFEMPDKVKRMTIDIFPEGGKPVTIYYETYIDSGQADAVIATLIKNKKDINFVNVETAREQSDK